MSGKQVSLDFVPLPEFAIEKVIGANHLRRKKPCQDAVCAHERENILAIAVADGHGSSIYADQGAQIAVEETVSLLVQFAENIGEMAANTRAVHEYANHPLRVQLVRQWKDNIQALSSNPEVDFEQYGSTLLFALATPQVLLIGQLGDGDILLINHQGNVETPLPPDPSAFADETPSLCQHEAWQGMKVLALPAPTSEQLLILSTDGYSKSYATNVAFHQIGPDYMKLIREEGMDKLRPHLLDFLSRVTTDGSGDDIAIAMLYWPPRTSG